MFLIDLEEVTVKNILTLIGQVVEMGFDKAGYSKDYGLVTFSNRPDLCQFQCNGAMAAAKAYKKNPYLIGQEVLEHIKDHEIFQDVCVIAPGFININIKADMVCQYLNQMVVSDKLGYENDHVKSVVVDYGGPNIAKPLHVGHLRSAVIGESIKRINKFVGNKVLGDIHLGDWGLQIGLVIEALRLAKPSLPYFQEDFKGKYPEVPPFTIDELSEIYPKASLKAKEDPDFKKKAQEATAQLQLGHPAYQAIWHHISQVSIGDLKSNYGKLNIEFDLWLGESHAQPAITEIAHLLKEKELLTQSQGAWVVEVEQESDKGPMPPFILFKSDGASLYSTTDLATIYQRVQEGVDEIIYVIDKRQELHFQQVFRTARLAGIAKDDLEMNFIGFGTMNGKDGKPFKTRDGGVMKLEDLIQMLEDNVLEKVMKEPSKYSEKDLKEIPIGVGLGALKFGDLINQASKDYVFDLDKFSKFEGKTGPYVQYSLVRINSILKKAGGFSGGIGPSQSQTEMMIQLKLLAFYQTIELAYKDKMPNKICEYVFELSNLANRFYHETYVLNESDPIQKNAWLSLLDLMGKTMTTSLNLLGIDALDKM